MNPDLPAPHCGREHRTTSTSFIQAFDRYRADLIEMIPTLSDEDLAAGGPLTSIGVVRDLIADEKKRRAAEAIWVAWPSDREYNICVQKVATHDGAVTVERVDWEYPHDSQASMNHAIAEIAGEGMQFVGWVDGGKRLYRKAA